MKSWHIAPSCAAFCAGTCAWAGTQGDPRLREVAYDPDSVVTVPVKRGVVSLLVFGADESIVEVASGLGADCAKPEAAWCVATQPGGRTLFVKPKRAAGADNNLAVVTDRRIHNLRFVVLGDADPRAPVYRLTIKPPPERPVPRGAEPRLVLPALPALPAAAAPETVVARRLQARPLMLNAAYSLAEGSGSQDIVPSLVFDDGRFTYLRFAGNRELPAVFHVLGDGSETLVNARMEDELLVVDRVSRRLVLRAGTAVVGIWNDAFDLDGLSTQAGTTVPGVRRLLKVDGTVAPVGAEGATP